MTATRNWSHNSFEKVMDSFVPLITADWMTYLKIIPIEYSDWSDTLYVEIEFGVTPEAENELLIMNLTTKEHFCFRILKYIQHYFNSFLNTNVAVKEFKCKN